MRGRLVQALVDAGQLEFRVVAGEGDRYGRAAEPERYFSRRWTRASGQWARRWRDKEDDEEEDKTQTKRDEQTAHEKRACVE